jgi:hypothetical protein
VSLDVYCGDFCLAGESFDQWQLVALVMTPFLSRGCYIHEHNGIVNVSLFFEETKAHLALIYARTVAYCIKVSDMDIYRDCSLLNRTFYLVEWLL